MNKIHSEIVFHYLGDLSVTVFKFSRVQLETFQPVHENLQTCRTLLQQEKLQSHAGYLL